MSLQDTIKNNLNLVELIKKSLKRQNNEIIGRDKDIKKITNLLRKKRGINLWGDPGVGKTTLARILYKKEENNFPLRFEIVLSDIDKSTSFKEKLVKKIEILLQNIDIKDYLQADLEEKFKQGIEILDAIPQKKLLLIDNILSFGKGEY
ncbi:MAG: AAA family ATPase, partial [Aquificae bacterium]|nr:AAA family ATPase [Aquificota bacterium]